MVRSGAGRGRWRDKPEPLLTEQQWQFLARLRCPTLLIRSGHSRVLHYEVAERMVAMNRRIEFVEIPQAGHWVHREQPEAYAAVVERFLDQGAPGTLVSKVDSALPRG